MPKGEGVTKADVDETAANKLPTTSANDDDCIGKYFILAARRSDSKSGCGSSILETTRTPNMTDTVFDVLNLMQSRDQCKDGRMLSRGLDSLYPSVPSSWVVPHMMMMGQPSSPLIWCRLTLSGHGDKVPTTWRPADGQTDPEDGQTIPTLNAQRSIPTGIWLRV